MLRVLIPFLIIFVSMQAFSEVKTDITGSVEWDSMQLNASVNLELASAGIRLPSGRTQGETLLNSGYLRLIQQGILNLQVDSSSIIGDLVDRGELSLKDAEAFALGANIVPPALSPDMHNLIASYTINLADISSSLLRHSRPSPVPRSLNPVSGTRYTGIIVIASDLQPVHSMRSSALAIPCLFPKIWDSEMNLIYERNMLEIAETHTPMVRYAPPQSIFQNNPSGLTPKVREIVGDRPLRIFARGVFGTKPTDLIIDRNDALLIISSEENRRLLSQGKVVFILNESVLRQEFKN